MPQKRHGYKNPPTETRFQPGTSGNPNGRPKGARNFKSDLRDELGELIAIREGDGERKISKQRAFIKAVVAAALSGDMRAATLLASLCVRVLATEADEDINGSIAPDDREILDAFVARELKLRSAEAQSVDNPSKESDNRSNADEG